MKSEQEYTQVSRRQFLSAATGIALGSAAGYASYRGLDAVANHLLNGLDAAEREVREMYADVRAFSGVIEEKLQEEVTELKQYIESGAADELVELRLMDAKDLSDFEEVVANYEETLDHYDFAERAKILKDRLDRRILAADTAIDSVLPDWKKDVDDSIRGLFGKPTGEERVKYRTQLQGRLNALCRVYDTNENNRIAQGKVVEKLNDYLNDARIPEEEREVYETLKEEFQKEGSKGHLIDFIRRYEGYNIPRQSVLKFNSSLNRIQELSDLAIDAKEDILDMQGQLKKGIALKESIRAEKIEDWEEKKGQYLKRVEGLEEVMGTKISELKGKGYDIETREDFIADTAIAELRGPVNLGTKIAGATIGAYVALKWILGRRSKVKQKAQQKGLKQAITDGEKAEASLQERDQQLVQAGGRIEDLEERVGEGQQMYTAAEADRARLAERVEELDSRYQETVAELTRAETRLDESQRKHLELMASYSQLQRELAERALKNTRNDINNGNIDRDTD